MHTLQKQNLKLYYSVLCEVFTSTLEQWAIKFSKNESAHSLAVLPLKVAFTIDTQLYRIFKTVEAGTSDCDEDHPELFHHEKLVVSRFQCICW